MVKLSRIWSLILMFQLKTFVESFQNVVFVNNKQMVFNPRGELVELENYADDSYGKKMNWKPVGVSNSKKLNWKPVQLLEKSNIFKNSYFVTKSNFQGGSSKVNSDILYNGSAINWFLPKRKDSTNRNHFVTKQPQVIQPTTPMLEENFDFVTKEPTEIALEFNDEMTSIENSLTDINEEIFKDNLETTTQKPIEPINENNKVLTFSYSVLPHATNVPVSELVLPIKKKKKQRKKNTKKKMKTSSEIMKPDKEIISDNLNSNRNILVPSFVKNKTKKLQMNMKPVVNKVDTDTTLKPLINSKVEAVKIKHRKKNKKKHVKSDEDIDSNEDDDYSSEREADYGDAADSNDYGFVGNFFNKVYNFFEKSLTSKEIVEYGKDISNSDSEEDYDDFQRKRRKRESTVDSTDDLPESRKSLTTKITVTSEYDDTNAVQAQMAAPNRSNVYQSNYHHSMESSIKKPIERPIIISSEESEELTLYDEIIGSEGDYDDISEESGGDEGDIDSYEYYDEPASNRLPEGDIMQEPVENSSEENDAPSFSFYDGIANMISKIGNFFSSFSGMGDSSPPSVEYDDYDDKGRSTTEKAEQLSKRPKRENEPLPWYQPSFLFSNSNDDDEESFSTTTHRNWMQSPWLQTDDDENEIATEIPLTTTTEDSTLKNTSEESSFNFLELVYTQFISPRKQATILKKKVKKLRRKNYEDYELWRLNPKSKDDVNVIETFKMSLEGTKVQWLKGPSSRGITDVVISPEYIETFKDFLSDNDIHFDVKVRDIQHAIQFENPRLNKRDQIELEVIYGHPLTWYRYHPYKDIQSYYEYLKRKFSNYTELIQIGWSFEGRPLTVVKVSYSRDDDIIKLRKEHRSASSKPAIFIQSGLEAHEWLPIACSTHILNNLVNNIESNDTLGEMLRKVDWYIMPVLNPDGYDYSIYFDRLWQKTRSKHLPSTGIWESA